MSVKMEAMNRLKKWDSPHFSQEGQILLDSAGKLNLASSGAFVADEFKCEREGVSARFSAAQMRKEY